MLGNNLEFPFLKKRDDEGFRQRKNEDEQEHLFGMFNVSCPKKLQLLRTCRTEC